MPVTDTVSAYEENVDLIEKALGQWRGAKAAACRYLECEQSQLSRWLRKPEEKGRVIMSGEILSKLLKFIEMPEAEQRTH
jgi:hypothetical protein